MMHPATRGAVTFNDFKVLDVGRKRVPKKFWIFRQWLLFFLFVNALESFILFTVKWFFNHSIFASFLEPRWNDKYISISRVTKTSFVIDRMKNENSILILIHRHHHRKFMVSTKLCTLNIVIMFICFPNCQCIVKFLSFTEYFWRKVHKLFGKSKIFCVIWARKFPWRQLLISTKFHWFHLIARMCCVLTSWLFPCISIHAKVCKNAAMLADNNGKIKTKEIEKKRFSLFAS